MTLTAFPASHGTPIQRNRRLLLALPACALPILSACGGGGGDLSYDTEQALYIVGEAIAPNNPKLSGGKPNAPAGATATFSVKPALPAGLTLNTSTGVISGTPSKLKRQATHTVTATTTARRARETAETQLRITVTGRGAWSPAASVPGARQFASIAPLPGGRFLVAGGLTDAGWTDSGDIYDPSSPTWGSTDTMQRHRYYPEAVTLIDGRVLVLAGNLFSRDPGATQLYDPTTNIWAPSGSMTESRRRPTVHLLASGKVLVVGGCNYSLEPLDTVELYEPTTGIWTLLPTRLSVPRGFHAAALLADGNTLLVAGGTGVTTAELYKVDGGATRVIPYGVDGQEHQAVKLDDGSLLVTSDGSNLSRRFNPATSGWTTSAMVSGARLRPTVTVLGDGRVLVAGGLNSNTAEIYNPDVGRWTAAAPMAAARQGAVAALLGDSSVLVVSGIVPVDGDDSGTEGLVNASERYLP